MGCIYYKVLKLKARAKKYFLNAVSMALSVNKNFGEEAWYDNVTTYLQEIRNEEIIQEDKDLALYRAKFMELCKVELSEIELQRKKSHKSFVKFILDKFKVAGQTLDLKEEDLSSGNMKKALLKVIRVYHPDKQKKHDKKWCFLAEEISKHLTNIYELYKA